MMDGKDIAAEIDLTLAEMLEAINIGDRDAMPRAGGDCDTLAGWTARLGLGAAGGAGYHKTDKLVAALVERGLAEVGVVGLARYSNGWRRTKLVRSAWMEREASKRL